MLPTIISKSENESSHKLEEILGKTISNIQFGKIDNPIGGHQSDGLIITFTDGSIFSVETASNAESIAEDFLGLDPYEFNTDLIFEHINDKQK